MQYFMFNTKNRQYFNIVDLSWETKIKVYIKADIKNVFSKSNLFHWNCEAIEKNIFLAYIRNSLFGLIEKKIKAYIKAENFKEIKCITSELWSNSKITFPRIFKKLVYNLPKSRQHFK